MFRGRESLKTTLVETWRPPERPCCGVDCDYLAGPSKMHDYILRPEYSPSTARQAHARYKAGQYQSAHRQPRHPGREAAPCTRRRRSRGTRERNTAEASTTRPIPAAALGISSSDHSHGMAMAGACLETRYRKLEILWNKRQYNTIHLCQVSNPTPCRETPARHPPSCSWPCSEPLPGD